MTISGIARAIFPAKTVKKFFLSGMVFALVLNSLGALISPAMAAMMPTQTMFTVQPPATATVGVVMTAFSASIWDGVMGMVDNTSVAPISLSAFSDATCVTQAVGVLGGTVTQAAVAGVVNYSDITFDTVGTIYLQASSAGLVPSCSNAITISAVTNPAPVLTAVSIASSNANPATAVIGDTVTLTFTSDMALLGLPVVTIDGFPAVVTNTAGNSYSATLVLTIADAAGIIPFTIDFTSAAGTPGVQVSATTDATSINFAGLAKYVDALPIPGVIAPLSTLADGTKYYEIAMTQVAQQLHRDLPPTQVWGYNGSTPAGTIEARTGVPVRVKWINNLPTTHVLNAVDPAIPGADMGAPAVRTVVHLHGGEVPPNADGDPEKWYTSTINGPQLFSTPMPGMPAMPIGIPGNFDIYDYPNIQPATTLWYHDHAMGATRLNVVAGLAGFYLLRDANEDALNLPAGAFEIPLAIQDRIFNADGSLFYPNPWSPEYFGDKIMVNGKVWPFQNVEPRKYRLRILNGSNARVYRLKFLEADAAGNVINPPVSGPAMVQIGTDGGFLAAPVTIPATGLLIAPGERADVIVDFSAFAGKNFILSNDAEAPYQTGATNLGAISEIMKFSVAAAVTAPDTSVIPATLNTIAPISQVGATSRDILMSEQLDPITGAPLRMQLNNLTFMDPTTDLPVNNTTEIWRFINTTMDTHPMHLHLVQYQILDRQAFQVDAMGMPVLDAFGKVIPTGPVMPPAQNEIGWKDTIQSPPGMITRVIMQFGSYTGRYVYHCHILEHEDNEMMRPFEVVPPIVGNVAPVITPVPAQVVGAGTVANVQVLATDANADVLSYSLVGATAGATIDPATGLISWTPAAAGTYTFTVRVTDGNTISTGAITATVNNTLPADIPVITPVAPQAGIVNTVGNIPVTATSPAGAALTYALPFPQQGLSIDPVTGVITFVPIAAGTYNFYVQASDGVNTVISPVTVNVTAAAAGGMTIAPITAQAGTANTAISIPVAATSPTPGATITYSLPLTAPAGATIDPATGAITFIPAAAGTYNFYVQASDGVNSVATPITITVAAAPATAPVITPIAAQAGTANGILNIPVVATSPAGSPLTYSLPATAPVGATIDPVTGAITFVPTVVGTYNFYVQVSDGMNTAATPVSVTVAAASPTAPVITPVPAQTGTANGTVNIPVTAVSPGGSTLTYSLPPTAPAGATIDPATGVITFTTATAGTYDFYVIVSDGTETVATPISIVINATPVDTTAPVITILGNNPETVIQNTSYADAGATAVDDVNGDITSSISVNNTVDVATIGSYTVTYTVSDAAGNTASQSRTVNVVAAPDTAPTIAFTSPFDGQTNVPLDASINGVFTTLDIDVRTVNDQTFTVKDSAGNSVAAAHLHACPKCVRQAEFIPASPLLPGETYTATLTTGVRNRNGVSLPAPYSWSFTTAMADAVIAPAVEFSFPADNETGVMLDKMVKIVFNKKMDPSTINQNTFFIKDAAGNVLQNMIMNDMGLDMYFAITPMGLQPNSNYTVTLTTGAQDVSGTPLAADRIWSFTTGGAMGPNILFTSPYNGQVGVSPDASINAVFTTFDLDASTVNDQTFTVKDSAGNSVTAAHLHVCPKCMRQAEFIPASPLLPNETYTVTLETGVKNLAGTALPQPFVWTFTTAASVEAVQPGIEFTLPLNGEGGVMLDKMIKVVFNKKMDPATVDSTTFVVQDIQGGLVTGTISNDLSTYFAITPLDLKPYTKYSGSLSSAITDAAGMPLPSATTWSFMTGKATDTTAPVITILGNNPETVIQNTSYTDAGATAVDDVNGDITSSISVNNTVDVATIGSYTVTYTVSDAAGNTASQSRTVNVVAAPDTTAPVITILSDNPETVIVNTSYIDEGATAFDEVDGDLTSAIIVNNMVDTSEIDEYAVVYTVTDAAGNTATATRTVEVVAAPDTTAPVITILGNNPETVTQGSSYVDAGATAIDNVSGDITASISAVSTVDTAVIGSYTVTYSVTDANNNMATAVRTVNVIVPDVAPVITILGNNPVVVFQNSAYVDAGATAADDVDGNITSAIMISSTVNTGVIGNYVVTYTVSDSAGNTTMVERTVNVVTAPVNNAPVILPIQKQLVESGQGSMIEVMAIDADSDSLSYSLSGTVPFGAVISTSTGVLTWVPSAAGEYTFGISVTDGKDVTTSYVTYTVYTGALEGDLDVIMNSGAFTLPATSTATSTLSVTVSHPVVINIPTPGATSTVSLPQGTVITKIDGTELDSTLLTATTVQLSVLTNLGSGVVIDGAIQWGIPSIGLQFSQPVSLSIYVGNVFNGQTLGVVRSTTGNSDWTTDGIVTPTCVISGGFCNFTATKASYYATTHTPAVNPPSGGGGGYSSSPLYLLQGKPQVILEANKEIPTIQPQILGVKTRSYEDGTLLKGKVSGRVYLITQGQKRYIRDLVMLKKLANKNVIIIDDAEINLIPLAGIVDIGGHYGDGNLLRDKNTKKVYVIGSSMRKLILSLAELKKYRGQKIYDVNPAELDKYPLVKEIVIGKKALANGTYLKDKDSKRVYRIQGNMKKYVTDPKELKGKKVLVSNADLLEHYPLAR